MKTRMSVGGKGDMTKETYDPNADGIIAAAQIGELPSTKITSAELGVDRIPVLTIGKIPLLNATKIAGVITGAQRQDEVGGGTSFTSWQTVQTYEIIALAGVRHKIIKAGITGDMANGQMQLTARKGAEGYSEYLARDTGSGWYYVESDLLAAENEVINFQLKVRSSGGARIDVDNARLYYQDIVP